MKRSYIFLFIILLCGVYFVNAQEYYFINGNPIEAKVINTPILEFVNFINNLQQIPNGSRIVVLSFVSESGNLSNKFRENLKLSIVQNLGRRFILVDEGIINQSLSITMTEEISVSFAQQVNAQYIIHGSISENTRNKDEYTIQLEINEIDSRKFIGVRYFYIPKDDKSTTVNNENSNKLIVGINANAGGLIPLGETIKSGGPSVNIEFIRNSFYSIINLSVPIEGDNIGFGFSGIFNHLWKSKIGGFYLGGGIGYTYQKEHFFTFGANVGYRFVTSIGMYFNTGGYIGGKVNEGITLDIKPILSVGYNF